MPSISKFATTAVAVTGTWTSATNATGSGTGTYATWTSNTASATGVIDVDGFGFSTDIPADAIINDVMITVRSSLSSTTLTAYRAPNVVVMDGTTELSPTFWCTLSGAAANEDIFSFIPTTAQVRSSTFKVRFTARKSTTTTTSVTTRLDFVKVTVHYSTPVSKTITVKPWETAPLLGMNNYNIPSWTQTGGPAVSILGGGSTRSFKVPPSMSTQTLTFASGTNTTTVNVERASTGIKQSDGSVQPVRMSRNPVTTESTPAAITPVIRSFSTAAIAGSTTNKAINVPAGTQEGDLLLLFFGQSSGEIDAMALPEGFTQIASGTSVFYLSTATNTEPTMKVGYRIATASEPASYSPSPDGVTYRADMICIQAGTWDKSRFPVGEVIYSSSSATTHYAPSIVPPSPTGLALYNLSIRSDSATSISWTPPSGVTELTNLNANSVYSMTTAYQTVNTSDLIPYKTFTLSRSNNTVERAGLGATIFVPGANSVPKKPYTSMATNGTTGQYADLTAQNFVGAGSTSQYHIYASHVDSTRPAPLVIHLHGDGGYEYDNPTVFTAKQYMNTARAMGAIGVIPNAVDRTAARAWWTDTAGADWLIAFIRDLYARYNIDKKRVYISGFSGGAVVTTEDLMSRYHSDFVGGGAMILGGGQVTVGDIVGTHSDQFKNNFLMRWHMGALDDGRNTSDNYNGRLYGENGEEVYRSLGVSTGINHIPRQDHNRSALYGPQRLQWLVNESYDLYGIGLDSIIS